MTDLYLIRHGETEWNRLGRVQGGSDIPLNANGRSQAVAARSFFQQQTWDAVYASPLMRAMETAEIIFGIPDGDTDMIASDTRLVERNYGAAEGLRIAERRERFADTDAIPGAEPWEKVMARGTAALLEYVAAVPDGRVAVVAHGGLIKSALAGVTEGRYSHKNGPLKNAGATRLTYNAASGWRVIWFNLDARDLAVTPDAFQDLSGTRR